MATEPLDDEIAPDAHGLYDATWNEERWRDLAYQLVADGLVTWREIATTLLGELNPPQVGTSIASSDKSKFGFKRNHATIHPGASFMPYVMTWFYATSGRCLDCGTRLDLQADHVDGRENHTDPMDADWLDNMALRCRRHNVAKRKSHVARAGRTLLPAQQALMWILLEIKPVTMRDLARLCRIYGMTMADIRFQEAWAMAIWLEREGHYRIAKDSDHYDLVLWPDNAVTRRFATSDPAPDSATILASAVAGDEIFCFFASSDGTATDVRFFQYPLIEIPFTYELGDRRVTDIAIWPNQSGGSPLPPRNRALHNWVVRRENQVVQLSPTGVSFAGPPTGRTYGGTRLKVKDVRDLSLTVK
ncbi:hypothetical protein [Nocardioides aurantiacus]|uniref:hypothetical protein n=1 Tax=Nocardioides aurantiacus TaxID=86796 RepID=UPI00403F190A